MLNAIGLANVGLDRFLKEKVPLLRKMPCPVIVNVAGHSFDDYGETCAASTRTRFHDPRIFALRPLTAVRTMQPAANSG